MARMRFGEVSCLNLSEIFSQPRVSHLQVPSAVSIFYHEDMFLLSSKGYAHVTNKTDDCLTMNFRCPNKQVGEVNNRGRLGFRVGGYERHVVNETGRPKATN